MNVETVDTVVIVVAAIPVISHMFAFFWLAILTITIGNVSLSIQYRFPLLLLTEYCILVVVLLPVVVKVLDISLSGYTTGVGINLLLAVIITTKLYDTSIFYIPRDHPQKDKIETTMRRIGIFNIGLGIILAIMYFLL